MVRNPKGRNKLERGKPAAFDPVTGEVVGSGSGAGVGNAGEDYDSDAAAGSGERGAPERGGGTERR